MKITRLSQRESRPVRMEGARGAFKSLVLGSADGVPNFSVRVFTLEPGGTTPRHAHPYEHVNYVIEGRGELWSEEGPHEIQAGDFMLVLPDERHQYRNTSDERLVFLCMVPKEFE